MPLPVSSKSQRKLAFIHIPKTAGTAIRLALEKGIGNNRVFSMGYHCTVDEWYKTLPPDALQDYSVIHGHTPRNSFNRFSSEFQFSTVIRDPIERTASFYNFMLNRRPDSRLSERLKGKTLFQAVTSVPRFQERIENEQCRYIAEDGSAASALNEIKASNWIVRTNDEIELFMEDVSNCFDWKLPSIERVNTGSKGYMDSLLGEETIKAIRELTEEDTKLFNAVRDRMF